MFNTTEQWIKKSQGQRWLSLLVFLCFFATQVFGFEVSHPQETVQGGFSIRWVTNSANPDKHFIEVDGLSAAAQRRLRRSNWKQEQWQRLFSVYASQSEAQDVSNLPPMLGSYELKGGMLRFDPQFPLEPGITYRAVFRPERIPGDFGKTAVSSAFKLPPRRITPATTVSKIYPSADLLPENLLKFYLHFSAPMNRGNIYDHIHLLDESGKEVELPFLEIDEELWDSAMTRLTLFIDPGRIKRGVKPLEEIGPSLETGKSYTLVISREWRDGDGNPLREDYRKSFKVTSPDREPPDPANWNITSPPKNSREPLAIVFPEPMEHALAQRMIRVASETGEVVAGTASLEDHERRWIFIPDNSWQSGQYNLIIQTTLEDLAGNNIGKPFEVDLFEGIQPQLSTSTVKLTFGIR